MQNWVRGPSQVKHPQDGSEHLAGSGVSKGLGGGSVGPMEKPVFWLCTDRGWCL